MKRFTLIELLVVVAVIGILASMLLPSLRSARLKTMGAVCKNNLQQLFVVTTIYSDDNDEYYMLWNQAPNVGKQKLWHKVFSGTGDGYPYSLSNAELKIIECPVIYSLTPGNLTRGTHRNIGMNGFLTGGYLSSSIPDPSDMILFGDGYNHHTNDSTPTPGFYSEAIKGTGRLGGEFDFIHSKKKNLIFADGHIDPKTRSFCAGNSRYWDPDLQ